MSNLDTLTGFGAFYAVKGLSSGPNAPSGAYGMYGLISSDGLKLLRYDTSATGSSMAAGVLSITGVPSGFGTSNVRGLAYDRVANEFIISARAGDNVTMQFLRVNASTLASVAWGQGTYPGNFYFADGLGVQQSTGHLYTSLVDRPHLLRLDKAGITGSPGGAASTMAAPTVISTTDGMLAPGFDAGESGPYANFLYGTDAAGDVSTRIVRWDLISSTSTVLPTAFTVAGGNNDYGIAFIIPEPGTVILLALGSLMLLVRRNACRRA